MARIKQPLEQAKLKNSHKKNPARYRNEVPKSDIPLGQPPEHLSKPAKALWFEIESYSISGTITSAERFIMEVLCNLMCEYRYDPVSFPSHKMVAMIGCFARLGLSPADRQKLGAPKTEKEDNEFKKFLQ